MGFFFINPKQTKKNIKNKNIKAHHSKVRVVSKQGQPIKRNRHPGRCSDCSAFVRKHEGLIFKRSRGVFLIRCFPCNEQRNEVIKKTVQLNSGALPQVKEIIKQRNIQELLRRGAIVPG